MINCKHLIEVKQSLVCEITGVGNPPERFCMTSCSLKFGHNADDSPKIFLHDAEVVKTEAKTIIPVNNTGSCSNELYVLLAHYFRQLCMACENNLHCDAKNFSKCLLKSSKWKTCPRGFWTEEMWKEALEKTKETK